MKIITEILTRAELQKMAASGFGDMIKAVVDIGREILAVDAELHADLEALLLEDGSNQKDLWGVNFYPELEGDGFLEYDSMINIRPSQGNRSRSIDNEAVREKVAGVVAKRVRR